MASSPIADLSYRNYDGPLEPPINRWWAIAKMSMRLSTKKKGFWIWSVATAYWYFILLIIFYFADSTTQAMTAPGQGNPFFKNIVWKDQFINAFSVGQLFFLILALLIGAGTIANDNRANALLVYLSKPCSKLDYVIGKWIGVFLPMTIVAAVPTLTFYAYCFMSYRSYGFITQDPWLIGRLLILILVPGTFHASASIGVSSLFKQGRLAGAVYAAVYFLSLFFSGMIQGIVRASMGDTPSLVKNLFYCSVDGLQIAMGKIILNTDGSQLLPGPKNGPMGMVIPAPSAFVFIPLFLGICAVSVLVAWTRIRAVEVVG